jgi:hypothetical protein
MSLSSFVRFLGLVMFSLALYAQTDLASGRGGPRVMQFALRYEF